MTNHRMTEDREVELWREQWSGVAPLSSEFLRQVQRKIKVQDRRFWLGNLLAAAALVGTLMLAFYQLSHYTTRFEKSQAAGVCVLLFVAVTSRLWLMRGTWRSETQSTRAFVELWQRRVLSRIRGLQIGAYIAIGWLVFGAALAGANWAAIRPDLMTHPVAFFVSMVIIAIMLPVIWFGVTRLRRRKVMELNEVTKLLEQMDQD